VARPARRRDEQGTKKISFSDDGKNPPITLNRQANSSYTLAIMSDSDEYEYDDDEMEEEQFEYTDDEEQADDGQVALENQYYNSKSLRDDPTEAAASFEKVIQMENDSGQSNGSWSFKALKQLVKLYLRHGDTTLMMHHYRRLLDCIAQPNSTLSPNAIEKGINAMLERIASLYQSAGTSSTASTHSDLQQLALEVYDATLHVFHPQHGTCQNERLWFKTNLKYGQLLYEQNDTVKLAQVLQDLQSVHNGVTPIDSQGEYDPNTTASSSTQSLEIYALQMQLYSRQKDSKRLREIYHKAMQVRGGIPHPRTLAMIQELGGKNFMASKEYEAAEKTFFQAFKSYDEAGDPNRLRCLKYLVLAAMLNSSVINPFDSQEARPYRDDPEIVAMTNLVQAFHNNDINTFERVVRQGRVMNDEFVREYATCVGQWANMSI
jgi:COP9 signalosome complex subunit 2